MGSVTSFKKSLSHIASENRYVFVVSDYRLKACMTFIKTIVSFRNGAEQNAGEATLQLSTFVCLSSKESSGANSFLGEKPISKMSRYAGSLTKNHTIYFSKPHNVLRLCEPGCRCP